MLNMPSHTKSQIEAFMREARANGASEKADLAQRALAGEHEAWLKVMRELVSRG